MMKSGTTFGLPALLLGSALGISAFAQTSTSATQTSDQAAASSTSSTTEYRCDLTPPASLCRANRRKASGVT